MGSDGHDAPAAGEAAGPAQAVPAPRARPRPITVGALAVLVAGLGVLAWTRTHPATAHLCTLTGAIDTPTASTPDSAVDAWWGQGGPAALRSWSSGGPVPDEDRAPSRDDLIPRTETSWEWRYTATASVQVDVAPAAGGAWHVVGVNRCLDGPVDGRR